MPGTHSIESIGFRVDPDLKEDHPNGVHWESRIVSKYDTTTKQTYTTCITTVTNKTASVWDRFCARCENLFKNLVISGYQSSTFFDGKAVEELTRYRITDSCSAALKVDCPQLHDRMVKDRQLSFEDGNAQVGFPTEALGSRQNGSKTISLPIDKREAYEIMPLRPQPTGQPYPVIMYADSGMKILDQEQERSIRENGVGPDVFVGYMEVNHQGHPIHLENRTGGGLPISLEQTVRMLTNLSQQGCSMECLAVTFNGTRYENAKVFLEKNEEVQAACKADELFRTRVNSIKMQPSLSE